jgi:serine/threonine protein kinase
MQVYHPTNWQGHQFKQYHVLELLKRDRLGALWLAEESQAQQKVVLRLLPGVTANTPEYQHLFEQMAQASTSLRHPHILSVRDSGVETSSQDEAIPYLVYPYLAQATTLHAYLRRLNSLLPTEEAFHLLYQLAEALDYAHSQQVIHGGLQPACCLLAGSHLLLTDFCLTMLLNSDVTRDRTYKIDVPYLAPEQVQGRTEASSDRYSLAVMAYQFFTGHLPFEEQNNPYDLMLQQLTLAPSAPNSFNAQLSSPVARVLLEALSRQPEQRSSGCVNLVETLSRAWRELPLDPLDDPDATLLAPWNKRARQQTSTTQSTEATLTSPAQTPPVLTATLAMAKKTMAPMRLTPGSPPTAPGEDSANASPGGKRRKGKLKRRTVLIGGTAVLALAAGSAVLLTRPIPAQLPPGPQQFTPGKPLIHLTAHEAVLTNVTWDASGRYLASGSEDRRVMLWDVGNILQQKPTALQVMSHPTSKWNFADKIESNSLHWTSQSRKLIISPVGTGQFVLLDPFTTTDPRQVYSNNTNVPKTGSFSISFTSYINVVSDPHSHLLAAIEYDPGKIKVQFWQEGQPTRPVTSLAQAISAYAPDIAKGIALVMIGWSCDGTMMAGLTNTMNLVIWDVKTHAIKKTFKLPVRPQKYADPNLVRPLLVWSPADPHVLAVAVIETIVVIDVHQEKPRFILSTDNKDAYTPPDNAEALHWVPQVLSFAWSPNGRYIVAGYSHALSTMAVWDLQKKNVHKDQEGGHMQDYLFPPPGTENAHSGGIYDISWSPDGRYLATGSVDKTILIWQVDASEA